MIPKPPFPWELSADREEQEFVRLKAGLAGFWGEAFPRDDTAYTSVVVPSLSLDPREIEKLAGAADRTSSELRQLAVERRAAQFERRGHGNASAGSTRTLPPILARGGSAPGLESTSGRSPSPLRVAAHVKRAEV